MSDAASPSLASQVHAVELAYLSHNGWVDTLRGLALKGKRSPEELAIAEMHLPALRQAWLTMKFVETNADKIRAATAAPNPGASGDAY